MQHQSDFLFVQAVLGEAMRERRLVRATYNSAQLTLAPHQIVLRNEAFYLGAVNPNKGRRVDEDPALGYFKIDGLSQVTMAEEVFEPLPADACVPPRPDDRVIAALD